MALPNGTFFDYDSNSFGSSFSGPVLNQGAEFSRAYQIFGDDGLPADLTGAVIVCEFDDEAGALVFASAPVITDAVNGKFSVIVSAATTAGVAPVPGAAATSTICAPLAFEFFDDPSTYQLLNFDVWITIAPDGPRNVIKGKARYYSSTNF